MDKSPRLRVLEIGKYYPPHRGGMETHVRTLCLALKDRVDLTVLAASETRSTTIETSDGFPVIRMGTWARVASAPLSPALPYYIWKSRPDVIHIHMPHPAAIPAYLLAAPKIPLVITHHSDIVRQKKLARAIAPVIERALQRASIICTSPQYLNSSPVLAHHRDRCRIVPLAISADEFAAADAAVVRQLRERYGPRLVLAAGRLVYYKGFEYVIRCMSKVDANLLIIGQGPLLQSLRNTARDHGVAHRVTFLDNVDDIAPYYHAADLFVLPSIARSEAFGIVQLEAMACGKPVVNTSLDTGVPFVSLDGVTGLTVAPKDSDALANAINLLLDRPDLRARLGKAARDRVMTQFDLATMCDSTLAILRQAAGQASESLPLRSSAPPRLSVKLPLSTHSKNPVTEIIKSFPHPKPLNPNHFHTKLHPLPNPGFATAEHYRTLPASCGASQPATASAFSARSAFLTPSVSSIRRRFLSSCEFH